MNVLRASVLRRPISYGLTAPRVLRALSSAAETGRKQWEREDVHASLPLPTSPSLYTTRPEYYDQLTQLKRAVSHSQALLKANHLLPLPEFARASLPPIRNAWKSQQEMSLEFRTKLTTTRHKKITKLLNELTTYQQIASVAGCGDLEHRISQVVTMFETPKKRAILETKRKPLVLDEFGRSYALGKRKTSSARVWMIPTKTPIVPDQASEQPSDTPAPIPVPTTTILVNNLPLHEFFTHPADRERITRPLKVAGVMGKYNVFAIVRGGGTTGQSGALAHGIAKGLVAHEPELEAMLRRAKLAWRDPRMVERKKTGFAKARKRYTWVKR